MENIKIRGRFIKLPRWLFGIVDKSTHKIHLEFVTKKDRTVIHPIIYRHVLRGSTINSDGAKVYKNLIHMGFQYNVVIHKNEFVAPDGTHTNNIENVWANLKMELKRMHCSQGQMLDGHIDEYMYRYNRKYEGDIFNLMLQDIANMYPV